MSNLWNRQDVPHKGWLLQDVIDLADPKSDSLNEYETCMTCGKEDIRYVHLVKHPCIQDQFRVGCVCAEKMTEDYINPRQIENGLRSRAVRRNSWVGLNWKFSKKGNVYLKKGGHIITIFKDVSGKKFKYIIDKDFGVARYASIQAAKWGRSIKWKR